MHNRRAFLRALLSAAAAAAAAPAIALPTLEEIERLGWRRRFFPGWSPRSLTFEELLALESLRVVERHLVLAREMNCEYEAFIVR